MAKLSKWQSWHDGEVDKMAKLTLWQIWHDGKVESWQNGKVDKMVKLSKWQNWQNGKVDILVKLSKWQSWYDGKSDKMANSGPTIVLSLRRYNLNIYCKKFARTFFNGQARTECSRLCLIRTNENDQLLLLVFNQDTSPTVPRRLIEKHLADRHLAGAVIGRHICDPTICQ